jgi:succinylglutamic semialdehyde dehydrogenase
MLDSFQGHFIGGEFHRFEDETDFSSMNPATANTQVLTAGESLKAVHEAVQSAKTAARRWRRAGLDARITALRAVQSMVGAHVDAIAEAITAEMGKPIGEARVEANSIAGKIEGVIGQLSHELPSAHPGAPGEQRFHPMGVVGVVGPFNFPIHLLNTHVIPALLTGNTVVIKPSDLTPLCGQRYAELFRDAGFPPGVLNVVQGRGAAGAEVVAHPDVDGIVFTGSYATGRRIRQATFDMPHKKVSLELGGKNPAVVLDDADLEQAVREILLGALLTTGQRCTGTSRVIATQGIADQLRERLIAAFSQIQPGQPTEPGTFMGPLASIAARTRFLDLLGQARREGARALVEANATEGGAWVTPGLYEVTGTEAFLREELFGPHVSFEVAASNDEAYARAADTPYGLSASLFSASTDALEDFYDVVRAGVINFNRSTNGASGLLPFGGIGMSGNWRPAGSCAPRLSTYPVAFMKAEFGKVTANKALEDQLAGSN